MAKYVFLVNWTEQGIRDVKETTDRAQRVQKMAEDMGGKIDLLLWTLGRYDIVGVFDMPDDESAALLGLKVGGLGTVRTETLRAFSADEMGGILGRLG